MRLLLVRHGESLGNVTRVLQGRDDPLTDRGRRQARQIGAHLAQRDDIRAIYTSPLARAFETSQIIGAAIGLQPEPREGLAEINVGTAAGLSFEDWVARFPDEAERFHKEGADYCFPGGESGRMLGTRIAAEVDRIVAANRDLTGTVVIVSHGGALAWILGHLLDDPRDVWPRYEFDNCSLTELALENGAPALVYRNEIGHLSLTEDEEVATGRV